jgi:hypothetical protein
VDSLYSFTLLLALVAAGGGLLLAAAAFGMGPRAARLARWSAWTALAAGAVSLGVHLAFGHAPGSPEALGPVAFVSIHPAYLAVAGLAAAGLVLARLAVRRADPTRQ